MSDTPRTDKFLKRTRPIEAAEWEREAKFFMKQLERENAELKEAMLLSVDQKCAKYHIQDCSNCLRADCCDNISPVIKEIAELRKLLPFLREVIKNSNDALWSRRDCKPVDSDFESGCLNDNQRAINAIDAAIKAERGK